MGILKKHISKSIENKVKYNMMCDREYPPRIVTYLPAFLRYVFKRNPCRKCLVLPSCLECCLKGKKYAFTICEWKDIKARIKFNVKDFWEFIEQEPVAAVAVIAIVVVLSLLLYTFCGLIGIFVSV